MLKMVFLERICVAPELCEEIIRKLSQQITLLKIREIREIRGQRKPSAKH